MKEHREAEVYRIYITDSLFYFADNKRLSVRYEELINPKPKDTRTAEQIVADIISEIGLHPEG